MNRELLNQPITGLGPIGALLEQHRRALLALWPSETPSIRPEVRPDGMRLYAKSDGGGAADTTPQPGVILGVWADTLSVQLPSSEVVTVLKPPHLRNAALPAFDATVLTDFQNGDGAPGSATDWDWFTSDYLMRTATGVDEVSESAEGAADGWTGGAQSRYRLVVAPFRDNEVATGVWQNRYALVEVIWPPYYTNGAGGANGPQGAEDIYVAQWAGQWFDVNVHARRWAPDNEASGEGLGYTGKIGGVHYRTINSNYSSQRV